MVKKKVKKKATKKNSKSVKKKESKVVVEGEKPKKVSKKVKENENRTLFWFFFWIGIVFAIFLGTYFYVEGEKHFEYSTIEWNIEEYKQFDIYHGRFPVLSGKDITFNIYHRIDPRKNEVYTEGNFSNFFVGSYLAFTPEIDSCRGDISRVMLDLGSFMKSGMGVGMPVTATTSLEIAKESGKELIDCSYADLRRTVIIMDLGEESSVIQDSEYSSCYRITVSDCNDIAPVEKFIVKSVADFRGTYGWLSNS